MESLSTKNRSFNLLNKKEKKCSTIYVLFYSVVVTDRTKITEITVGNKDRVAEEIR